MSRTEGSGRWNVRNHGGNLTPGLQTTYKSQKQKSPQRRTGQMSGSTVVSPFDRLKAPHWWVSADARTKFSPLNKEELSFRFTSYTFSSIGSTATVTFPSWLSRNYKSTSFLQTLKPNKRQRSLFKVSQNYSGTYCKAFYIRACGYSTRINAQPIKQTPQTQEGIVSISHHQDRHHPQTTTRFLKVQLDRMQDSFVGEMLTAQDSNRPRGKDEIQGQALTAEVERRQEQPTKLQ